MSPIIIWIFQNSEHDNSLNRESLDFICAVIGFNAEFHYYIIFPVLRTFELYGGMMQTGHQCHDAEREGRDQVAWDGRGVTLSEEIPGIRK